ncbi:dITP/XTP pyrophosphatase [Oceanococcus atlanticus]|uniref:dITP/XTP pyrophosphatase n=1 Tax=Oceanococcus atlanticus TaxID=1317117 RepID=A0A1Y1SAU0_9GAMM|nr:RdgB/HAM1 family non-canonical purine NTP pyrophosphatase [Oceanococcus atlanticus]ORE85555.1 dITP/XTP pyrophosphatase [Oceanococcus atlanticus]
MSKDVWVLASGNRGKLAELQHALAPLGHELKPISDWTDHSPEETGDTFEANALIKARHAAARSGLPSLADDSGLAVDALNGAPGVYSARYAGDQASDADNNRKLLAALADVPPEQRGARFVCVIALVRSADDPSPLIARGEWKGHIADQPSGDGGFGYDPLFVDPQLQRSAAQLSREDKLARSHRGQAIADLLRQLSAA